MLFVHSIFQKHMLDNLPFPSSILQFDAPSRPSSNASLSTTVLIAIVSMKHFYCSMGIDLCFQLVCSSDQVIPQSVVICFHTYISWAKASAFCLFKFLYFPFPSGLPFIHSLPGIHPTMGQALFLTLGLEPEIKYKNSYPHVWG